MPADDAEKSKILTDLKASLEVDLKSFDARVTGATDPKVAADLEALLNGLVAYKQCRLDCGSLLIKFRDKYKPDHNWIEFANIIAKKMGWSVRKVFRLADEFEAWSAFPPVMIETIHDRDLQLTATDITGIAEVLKLIPKPETRADADAAIGVYYNALAAHKVAPRKSSKTSQKPKSVSENLESLGKSIMQQVDAHLALISVPQPETTGCYICELIAARYQLNLKKLQLYAEPADVPLPPRN